MMLLSAAGDADWAAGDGHVDQAHRHVLTHLSGQRGAQQPGHPAADHLQRRAWRA
jgi:hypothetical protein